MEYLIFFLIIAILVIVILFLFFQKKTAPTDIGLKLILEQINELNRTVDSKISENMKEIGLSVRSQFSESAKIIKDVTEGLTKLDETNKQVISFADQLKNLQDILKNPKQRGVLGEYYLETLLRNVLPPGNFQMQYQFKNGEVVDAVVFVKNQIIPIDSKFSLENYNRLTESVGDAKEALEKTFLNDLKMRIKETAKYIRPEEGTMDFAFMFIPHEAIYYDLLTNRIGNKMGDEAGEAQNLIQTSAGKYKVIIVSPTSFLAYLQTVLQGLKSLQIEETAKDIIKRVEELSNHLRKYEEYQNKLGNSLQTTVNHFNSSNKEFKKVDKDIVRIVGIERGVDLVAVDVPESE